MNIEKIVKQIQKHKNKIATERDKLREILNDLDGECDSFDNGIEDLQRAIDSLSEYV